VISNVFVSRGSYDFDDALPAFLKSVEISPNFGRGMEGAGAIYFGKVLAMHMCLCSF
jgi:hypothetical protein